MFLGKLQLFRDKVGRLREAIDAEAVRGEAAEILSTLVESVTLYPAGEQGPEAEMVAKVADLVTWATNDNVYGVGCGDGIRSRPTLAHRAQLSIRC